MDDLTPSRLSAAVDGISLSYASMILSGDRQPSREKAIAIFRATGRKFPPIDHLSNDDVETLGRLLLAKAA